MFFGKVFLIGSFFLFSASSFSQIHQLPPLKYSYAALEPYIDSTTMKIHHTLHHQAYINNLNKALVGSENTSMNDLLLTISTRSEVIRNNAGGHYNHSLFWEILTPTKGTKPSAELQKAIEINFGHLDSLKKFVNKSAATRFGSGWAWVIVTADGKLAVTSTPNQDNPLMDNVKDRGIPIIAIDVWEHAYYLKYQNKRGDYLGAIWNVIDWNKISEIYSAALKDPLLKKIATESH
jgi:Fe-Mn family superoxide dismutase